MFCGNCGKQIADGAKFCPYCGAQQAAPAQAQPRAARPTPVRPAAQPPRAAQPAPAAYAAPNPPQKRKRWPIVLVVVLLLAALAAVGYLVVWPMWQKQRYNRAMDKVEAAFKANDYDAALQALDEAVAISPDDIKAGVFFASTEISQNNLSEAEKYMDTLSDRALQENPEGDGTGTDPLFALGTVCYSSDGMEAVRFASRNGNTITTTEYKPDGTSTFYSQSDLDAETGNVTRELQPSPVAADIWEEYTYDTDGNMVSMATYSEDHSVSDRWVYTYDDQGMVTAAARYDGSDQQKENIEYTYDKNGNMLTRDSTCTNGETTTATHNEYTYDEYGNILTTTYRDENNRVYATKNEYKYDADGNVVSKVEYNTNGEVSSRTETTYDDQGRQKASSTYQEDGTTMTSHTKWAYDENTGEATETYCTYDDEGKISDQYKTVRDADGNVIEKITSDSDGNETEHIKYVYENGRLIKTTNEISGETERVYYAPKDVLQEVGDTVPAEAPTWESTKTDASATQNRAAASGATATPTPTPTATPTNEPHTYKVYYDALTWEEAEAACEARGGHLATITSEEEAELIKETVGDPIAWIGASCDANGNWSWVTGETWEYADWKNDEVPTTGCAVMGEYGGWRTADASNIDPHGGYDHVKYLCEWDGAYQEPEITNVVGEFAGEFDNPGAAQVWATYSIDIENDGQWRRYAASAYTFGTSYLENGTLYLTATKRYSWSNGSDEGWIEDTPTMTGVATLANGAITINWTNTQTGATSTDTLQQAS